MPILALLVAAAAASETAASGAALNAPPGDAAPKSVFAVRPLLDGALIAGTAGGTLVTYLFAGSLIHPRCPCDPAEVNALDRSVIGNHSALADATSNVMVGAALLAPVVADALGVGLSKALLEDLTVEAEALAVNGALVTLVKYTVQRPLPVVYAGQAPELIDDPGGYRSFYSGHTSLAVASLSTAAVTWTLRHGASPWPWIATAATGVGVAALRIEAGRHFYSDVGVGALAGFAVGTLIPLLHRLEDEDRRLALVPALDGVGLVGRF